MPNAENFIAVDWRRGGDKCHFFFKDKNEYYRFDNRADRVSDGYPKPVTDEHWGGLHQHVKNLRFGFATDRMTTQEGSVKGVDILWLFYYDDETPMFCEYDQRTDSVRGTHTVAGSIWAALLPYFDRIVAGTWWERPSQNNENSKFRFLLNDGNGLDFNWNTQEARLYSINETTWPGLEPFKHRIITAVQMYSETGDSYYYVFLTDHQYLKFNIDGNRLTDGARSVYGGKRWPGLFEQRELKNFVAVDWRAGKDRYYFFFKDDKAYSRFDIGKHRVADGHPTPVTQSNWGEFHNVVKNLRFGFTTTNILKNKGDEFFDQDFLFLFYYSNNTPMVCKYNQDTDQVVEFRRVASSVWRGLLPYFDNIIAGTWWEWGVNWIGVSSPFRFLMNNGQSLWFNLIDSVHFEKIRIEPIDDYTWPGLAQYQHRIITAVQNDRAMASSLYYIFLTDNEFLTYDMLKHIVIHPPRKVDESTWPGLIYN
jgi:hypothetical protein